MKQKEKYVGLDNFLSSFLPSFLLSFLPSYASSPSTGILKNLHSLTALNLERNTLQSLVPEDFMGINDTLSSLSLLNNLITSFPVRAFNSLSELRVSKPDLLRALYCVPALVISDSIAGKMCKV